MLEVGVRITRNSFYIIRQDVSEACMRFIKTITILAIIIFLQCSTLQQLMQKPTVRYERVKMETMSFTKGTFVFQFQITNPNPVGLSISRVDYDLELNGQSFIKGDLPKGIQLPSQGSTLFEVPVILEYFKFFKSLQDFMRLDQIPYSLKGTVTVGPFQIPFTKTGHFDKPVLPKVSLKTIHISKLSLTGASMVVKLSMWNANAFPVHLSGVDYNIKLSDVSIAKGGIEVLDPIEENGEVELRLPIDVGFLNLGRSVYDLLKNSSVNYFISGHLKSKSKDGKTWSFPIEKSGQVSIIR